jgi:cyclohexyl-isocyanide hydratase
MDAPLLITERRSPSRERKHLTIGCLIFSMMDQIDFTGPFEVLSRLPDATIHVLAKTKDPIHDVKGLILTPEMTIAETPALDVLVVPGGFGQQALMNDDEVLPLIQDQAESGRWVFSICTGALLCGAAGILNGRHATTHWAAWDLLPFYGAIAAKARVVVDGKLVTSSGVTAGIDGALVLASLLRGEAAAEEIQLSIQYAPAPVFNSGSPDTARAEVLSMFNEGYKDIKISREAEARRFAKRAGIGVA